MQSFRLARSPERESSPLAMPTFAALMLAIVGTWLLVLPLELFRVASS